MSRILNGLLPHPYLTIILTLTWLLLVNTYSLGSLVFGLILGLLIPIGTAAYWPNRAKIKKPFKLFLYLLLVIWDVLVANVEVAWLIVTRPNSRLRSCWISIPLDIRTPEAITILASTITLTPGTVSSDMSDKGHALLVHVLDTGDPDGERDRIKSRYERRLKEIFE